jgi:hypothetical protein
VRDKFFRNTRGGKTSSELAIIVGEMRKKIHSIILLPVVLTICCHSCGPREIPKNKVENIERFLRNAVKDNREEDYRRHDINIEVFVTGLKIERLTTKETEEDNEYFVQGKVSYVIKGKRKWKDKEGNIIELEPEQEITRWFSCGILEDKYIGVLFKDKTNRLSFYADSPIK